VLYRALSAARDRYRAGERRPEALLGAARAVLAMEPRIELEYLELRRDGDLAPLPEGPVLSGRMLVAARLGTTRLIDNLSNAEPESAP
jgi:pantoate--beta-alanine ligase